MAFHRVRFGADPVAVRAALVALERGPVLAPLAADHRSAALLALAEVANNIAEHAYPAGAAGDAVISLWMQGGEVAARIMDQGRIAPPIPDVVVPVDPDDLPEGGFGLQLIRVLARDISQRRRWGCNMVRLCVGDQTAP